MATADKRVTLAEICRSIPADRCGTKACPLKDSCILSETSWIPEDAELPNSDVEIIYNDYVKRIRISNKEFNKKLTSLVGEKTARDVREAIRYGKPILIKGPQGPTGKTTLCNLINDYGGTAVEEKLCLQVTLDKLLDQ